MFSLNSTRNPPNQSSKIGLYLIHHSIKLFTKNSSKTLGSQWHKRITHQTKLQCSSASKRVASGIMQEHHQNSDSMSSSFNLGDTKIH
jgi:hypothetical protein